MAAASGDRPIQCSGRPLAFVRRLQVMSAFGQTNIEADIAE